MRHRMILCLTIGLWLTALLGNGNGTRSLAQVASPTPTPVATSVPSQPPNQPSLAPPALPLHAWTVAADGAVFVLDDRGRVYELSPSDLTPIARSPSLFSMQADAPVHLAADEDYLFAGSEAITQTLVLSRADFSRTATLAQAGSMALDPGKRLFLIPQEIPNWTPYTWAVWSYDLADLSQPPQSFPTGCLSGPLVADVVGRRLYVQTRSCQGSPPHQGDFYVIHDFDTFNKLGTFTPDPFRGDLERPAIARRTGLGATVNHGLNGIHDLHLFNRQGLPVRALHDTVNGVAPVLDASGAWLYLLYPHGLASLQVKDLSLQSFLPFTATTAATDVVTDMALSPNDDTLYLFGPEGVTAHSTDELKKLGIQPISPFPPTWLQITWNREALLPYLYPSPEIDQDGTLFLRLGMTSTTSAEVYRSDDRGRSWHPLPVLDDYGVAFLSLSPDFAEDHTLTTDYWRSTDGGDSWNYWTPRLAFVSERDGNREVYTTDEFAADLRRMTDSPAADENPAWSPAWTRLAFQSNRSGNWDIFTLRAECEAAQLECDLQQLTDHAADDLLPAWSPDGRTIAFVSTRDGNPEIYLMDKDGGNQRRLTFHPGGDWRPAWLPDSRRLVFTSDRSGNNDIYLVSVPPVDSPPLTSEPPVTAVVSGPADDRDPAVGGTTSLSSYFDFDQNGLLAFLSDRDGVMKSYVAKLDGSGGPPERFTDVDQEEGHPSWFKEYSLLVSVGQEAESELYRLTPFGLPTPIAASPGFDGHPAGGPVWWLPDATAGLAWLTEGR